MTSSTDRPGALMAAEIAEQPEVLARLLAEGTAQIGDVTRAIERYAPRFVLLAARGTSDHAALYAKYLVETRLGRPAGLVSPSSFTVYGTRPDLSQVLFVAVSQSGGSPDLVDSTQAARDCGALTLAVTNNPSSALAATAELHVDVHAGAERSVAATKTYTAQLLALALLFAGADTAERAAGLPDAAATTLDHPAAREAAGRYRYATRLVTTARGYSYPTAREAALKLMETSYLGAQAFSAADLLHGPLAMIDSGVPVLAVVSPGKGGEAMTSVLERLAAVGADVLRVGAGGDVPVAGAELDEALLPMLEILPLQRLALQVALDRGGDPDRPRGLNKITETW
jgi:glutamine---fructose-6-phosphate transaminase (isomerizing)